MTKVPVTVIIPTLNEETRIRGCIDSVRWAAELIVADGGSDDRTVELARECGARVLAAPDLSIGARRNLAIESASHHWILALDADELAGPGLRNKIAAVVAENPMEVFSLRRRNFFEGREVRWGGWGSDRVIRLFPSSERFDSRRVHEKLVSALPSTRLGGDLLHHPYDRKGEFEMKLERYSSWAAADLRDASAPMLRLRSWVRPPARVFRMLFLQLGFLDGRRGFKLSWMAARSVRWKYRRALDLARTGHRR